VVLGGNRRQDSVRIGLDQIKSSDYVMIHDGARPCVSPDLIRRGMMASENSDAAIPVVPITDTVKMLKDSMVMSTMDRSSLYASQTPQVFKYKTIAELHLTLTSDVTDDAAIIEIHGGNVSTYDGDPENIKMTNPIDIEIAETILKRRKGK
jgi:2-C-methyl-D-erythritol 4-phosphate cytidylyltransferase